MCVNTWGVGARTLAPKQRSKDTLQDSVLSFSVSVPLCPPSPSIPRPHLCFSPLPSTPLSCSFSQGPAGLPGIPGIDGVRGLPGTVIMMPVRRASPAPGQRVCGPQGMPSCESLLISSCSLVPFCKRLDERTPSLLPAGPGPGGPAAGSGECVL